MISLTALVHFVVVMIILGLIVWLLYWLLGYCNVPEPFNKMARIVLAVFSVLIIIGALLHIIGYPVIRM